MARLIVEAVSAESSTAKIGFRIRCIVSVSRADDGSSVSGLDEDNFRICCKEGAAIELKVASAEELKWEPSDMAPAGCYVLEISRKVAATGELREWAAGEFYSFGIQARANGRAVGEVHTGQTVVRIDRQL